MRKSEIKVGEVYAVVGSRHTNCEVGAQRAMIVKDEGQGWWLVRFDEEMTQSWGTLTPAREAAKDRGLFLEHKFMSSCVIAPWDEHVLARAEVERQEQMRKERLETEKLAVGRLVDELGTLLKTRLSVEPPHLVTGIRFDLAGDGLWRGQVTASPHVLEALIAAVKLLPDNEASALQSLLEPAL